MSTLTISPLAATPRANGPATAGARLTVSESRGPLRLTRRGRFAVVLLLAVLALVAFSLGRVSTEASTDQGSRLPVRTVVVQPGETLWQVAREVAPGVDPRVTVDRIIELNALPDAAVAAGQEIAVPDIG